MAMVRKDVLDAAAQCVTTDREAAYGAPEDNFKRIAKLWSAYSDIDFTAHDVGIYLALVKIGRISSGQVKADNYVDLAGYAACAGEIATERRELIELES